MEEGKIREWWFDRQGLDGSLAGKSTADVVGKTGWVHSFSLDSPKSRAPRIEPLIQAFSQG